jgi:hypothetical protein
MYPAIVIIPTQGLCNRLRAIASAHILSKHLETKMFMIWTPEECCPCEFTDLFKNHFNSIDINNMKTKKYIFNPNVHTETLLRNTKNLEEMDYIIIQGGHEFKSNTMSEETFILEKTLFYKSLICVNDIDDYVSNFTSKWFNTSHPVVGVHYRDFIPKYDQADGRDFSKESPIDIFVNRIKEIHTADDSVHFYLSSNSKNALNIIKHNIPTAVFISETDNELTRDSKTGIKHALRSLIILSKTQYILGTYMSSFSDEACFFKLIPKECVGGGNNGYRSSYHCYGHSFVFERSFILPSVPSFLKFQNAITENSLS